MVPIPIAAAIASSAAEMMRYEKDAETKRVTEEQLTRRAEIDALARVEEAREETSRSQIMAELESRRMTEKSVCFQKMLDTLHDAYNNKLASLNDARSNYQSFYLEQTKKLDEKIQMLLDEKKNAKSIKEITELTASVDKLYEHQDSINASYRKTMIQLDREISKTQINGQFAMNTNTLALEDL